MEKLAIVLTDTHLKEKNIEINKSIYSQAIKLAKENGLKCVYHGGDIFDSRKAQPLIIQKSFEDILDMFLEENIELIAIPGNHDKSDYTSKHSFLDAFRHHPAFNLITEYDNHVLSDKIDLCLIPFFDEKLVYSDYLKLGIKTLTKNKKNILLTHIAINGVKNNDGSVVEHSLDSKMFNNFEKVICGHYHNNSLVNGNVYYIGSAFQHNYGEDENKGFTFINKDGSLEFVRSEFPEYKKILIDISDFTTKDKKQLLSQLKNNSENIRVVFKGSYEELQSINKSEFSDIGIDVKLEPNEIQEGIIEAFNNEVISFDKKSIISEFEEYCEINNIKNKQQGLNYLKKSIA